MTSAIYFTHLLIKSLDEIGAVALKNKLNVPLILCLNGNND